MALFRKSLIFHYFFLNSLLCLYALNSKELGKILQLEGGCWELDVA